MPDMLPKHPACGNACKHGQPLPEYYNDRYSFLVRDGVFRLGLHTNAFAIVSDSVVLSSLFITITYQTIPV